MQCYPILNYTENFKAREFGLKSIAKCVPTKMQVNKTDKNNLAAILDL